MPRPIRLNDEVRPNGRVSQQDLGQVRAALSRLGLFDPARDPSGSESVMSDGLRRALRTLQAAQGLREDATLRPRGPTEARLNRLLERNLSLRPDDGLAARERTPEALAGRVGPGLENHPDDVAAVGAALRQLGHIPQGAERPLFTGSVFDGLKSFQRASGLARDAVTLPGGPTEQLLVQNLSARSGGSTQPILPAQNLLTTEFRGEPASNIPIPKRALPPDPTGESEFLFGGAGTDNLLGLTGDDLLPEQAVTAGRNLHPISRARQRSEEARRQRAVTAARDRREAERLDAQRKLDRSIQREVGGPIDRSSDQVDLIAHEREFSQLSPEEQDRERDRLRRIAAVTPEEQKAEEERQRAEEAQRPLSPTQEGRQRSARVLEGIRPPDGGNPPDTSATRPIAEDADADFLMTKFAKSTQEDQAKIRRIHTLAAGSDRRGLQKFLNMYKDALAGTGADIKALNDELDEVLTTARDLDNDLINPFLVGTIIQNLIDLDPEGLGPSLGFVAQAVHSDLSGPSPGNEAASPLASRAGSVGGRR